MEPIIKEVTLHATASTVWKAITDKEEMKAWYFDIAEFEPVVGFEFTFYGENEGRKFQHLCKVLEVIPQKKLKYTWRYEVSKGDSIVSFELFEEGNTTRVKLTHEGLELFANDGPDYAKENFVAGWNHIIGTSLKEHVEKQG